MKREVTKGDRGSGDEEDEDENKLGPTDGEKVQDETCAMMNQVDIEKGSESGTQFDSNGIAICSKSVSFKLGEVDSPEIEFYRDNWLHKFLCYTWYGRVANLTCFLTLVYFTFFTHPHPERAFFSRLFPNCAWFFLGLVSMNLVLVLFVYPLSRISSSPKFYWLIGIAGTIVITSIGLSDWKGKIFSGLLRFGLAVEFSRLTMKVVSFLVECGKSKETFDQTNCLTLLYFMFAPTLKYKSKYPKTPKIRLISLIHYISWIVLSCFLLSHLFFNRIVPLVKVDVVTLNHYGLGMMSLYIFIFSPFVYASAVMFGYFELWNGLWGELLRFPDRRGFGEPADFLVPTKIIRAMNVLVTDFLSKYIYKPIHDATKSRLMALTAVFVTSLTHHEICLSYTLTQILFVNLLPPILSGIFLLKRKPNIILDVIRQIFLLAVFPFYLYLHIIEYFAWNTSSISNLESEKKIRLIPLSLGYLIRAIFYQSSTGSVF